MEYFVGLMIFGAFLSGYWLGQGDPVKGGVRVKAKPTTPRPRPVLPADKVGQPQGPVLG